MKKIIPTLILILTFTAYSIHTRIINKEAPIALTPEPNKPKTPLVLPTYNNPTPTTPKPTPSPTPTPKPTPSPTPTPTPAPKPTGKFKDGSYTGNSVDAYYGNVQVKAIVSGGKLVDVQFLDHPGGRQTSIYINERAMPYLTSEAISIQDSNVDTVSGASFTSGAFRKSLASALAQAKV